MLFIGLDDTDNEQSRGTGHLARDIATVLAERYPVAGVVRHQLLDDPRIPCTKKNSAASIIIAGQGIDAGCIEPVFEEVRALMLADFQAGSDPGLCVAFGPPRAILAFGGRAQRDYIPQAEARTAAQQHHIRLEGLGGTHDGVIGALAAVGLCASGEDGRYVTIGHSRKLAGPTSIQEVLAAGITEVRTLAEEPVTEGVITIDKLRPSRRGGVAVAYVEPHAGGWRPLKLD